MRILYGVQGTGNGHLSRARAMARAFAAHPQVQVDWLFSGRAPGDYFDMGCFGAWAWLHGLSFAVHQGRIAYLPTALQLRPLRFLRDVHELAVADYDAVISDFEPITAWAARRRGLPCIGIGHQYAFKRGFAHGSRSLIGGLTLKHYAPVSTEVGVHWDRFGELVMPPILDIDSRESPSNGGRVLVYLPFENQAAVIGLLQSMPAWNFDLFGPRLEHAPLQNVTTHPVARGSFFSALLRCSHVICNSGFELISEALSLGKRILTRPLRGQLEQESNAFALRRLGYAETTTRLDASIIGRFLDAQSAPVLIRYPDVAAAVARWVASREEPLDALCARLWSATVVERQATQAVDDARASGAASP